MGTEETLADLEARTSAPAATDLDKVVLTGDDVPEIVRGKTAKQAIAALTAAIESVKTGSADKAKLEEELSYLKRTASAPTPSTPATPAGEEEKPLTKAQLDELYKTDPLQAMAVMVLQGAKMMERNLDSRIAPLRHAGATIVEGQKRAEYKTEFDLFGPQIEGILKQVPDRGILADPKAWDNIIAHVRGQPENFTKLVEHAAKGGGKPDLRIVRETAAAETPASLSTPATPATTTTKKGAGEPEWSADEDKVRQSLGHSVEEWRKYR